MTVVVDLTSLVNGPLNDGVGTTVVTYGTTSGVTITTGDSPSDLLMQVTIVNNSAGAISEISKQVPFTWSAGSEISFTPPLFNVTVSTSCAMQVVQYLGPGNYQTVGDAVHGTMQPNSLAGGTTSYGTIIIGSAGPAPLVAGTTITVTGPDVGVCTTAVIGYQTVLGSGAQHTFKQSAALTFVDQNTATFTCPDLGITQVFPGFIYLVYTLNGITSSTPQFAVGVGPVPNTPPPAPSPPPTYGYGIPDGPMGYPAGRVPWTFTDPYDTNSDTNSYTFPINPNKMTTPFPTRVIQTAYTTAISGQVLLTEGAPTPAQWKFSGSLFNASHYDALRSWVYERNRRIIVTDHYGRQITCVLQLLDAQPPEQNVAKKYWYHTYTIQALVVNVSPPTEIPT